MTKDTIIKGAVALIEHISAERKLSVEDRGTGHAFDNTIWKGMMEDSSGIPNIIAKGKDYSIELRSFWGDPEIDVRRKATDGEELLIFNYSDSVKRDGEYVHTGEYRIQQVRVESKTDYKKCIEEVYELIDFLEKGAVTGEE